jgi:multidrug efflux pump subunit AcrA (membrane-fusion protein)
MSKERIMTKNIKGIAAGAGLLILLSVFTSCSKGGKDGKKTDDEAATVFAVSSIPATKGELKDYLEFGGDVTAKTNIDALPDVAGRVAEVRVKVGDLVEKDQILVLVDPSRPGMNYAHSPVKAPVSGTITAVNVVTGSMVSQQYSVAKVSKMETLQVVMNVPERYVSKIKNNQTASLRFDAYPGEVFPASITEVSPVLDQNSRTMTVKLALAKTDSRIKAGMFARVKLITDTKTNIVKIPASAVVTRFGESYVFVVIDGETPKARKQNVTVGIRVDDKVEILTGVNPGQEVIVRGQTLLEDGSLINVVSKLEPLPSSENSK